MNFDPEALSSHAWNATGGALIVLFLSIINESRRTWYRILIGCVFGAIGASAVGFLFAEQWWVYPACGLAAVMTENVLMGFMNMSKQFSDDPIKVFSHFWKMVMPTFGKATGESDYKNPDKPDESKG